MKRITRRRTKKEVEADELKAKHFLEGFALSLILLCQDETNNMGAQEIIEIRCKQVFEEAGYTYFDLQQIDYDEKDKITLANIFEIYEEEL